MCLSRDSVKKIKEVNIMSCPWSHFSSVGDLSHRDLWPAASFGSFFRECKKTVCCGLHLAYHWSILLRLKPKWLQNTWQNNNRTSQPILKGFSLDFVQNNVFKSQPLHYKAICKTGFKSSFSILICSIYKARMCFLKYMTTVINVAQNGVKMI